jgi:hypothetical protein
MPRKICPNCGAKFVLGGVHDQYGTFCSMGCRNNFAHPGFCQACIAATTPAPANDNITVIPIGFGYTFLGPSRDKCETCGSVVESQWVRILFVIPLFRVGTYRVKYVAPNRFLSRELRKKPKGSENRRTTEIARPPPLPSNFCSRCGSGVQAEANFCHACGAPIRKNAS